MSFAHRFELTGRPVRRGHYSSNPAAHIKIPHNFHESGRTYGDEIIEYSIRDGLMKVTLIPEAPQIELETLQLNTSFVRYITNLKTRKVWLTCFWAQTGKFRTIE